MRIDRPGPKIEELLKNIDIRTQAEREKDTFSKLCLIAATVLVVGQLFIERELAPELYHRLIAKDYPTQIIQNYN